MEVLANQWFSVLGSSSYSADYNKNTWWTQWYWSAVSVILQQPKGHIISSPRCLETRRHFALAGCLRRCTSRFIWPPKVMVIRIQWFIHSFDQQGTFGVVGAGSSFTSVNFGPWTGTSPRSWYGATSIISFDIAFYLKNVNMHCQYQNKNTGFQSSLSESSISKHGVGCTVSARLGLSSSGSSQRNQIYPFTASSRVKNHCIDFQQTHSAMTTNRILRSITKCQGIRCWQTMQLIIGAGHLLFGWLFLQEFENHACFHTWRSKQLVIILSIAY